MGLEQVVNVQISRKTAGVSAAGFGVPCILGTAGNWPVGASDKIRAYSSLAGVLSDFASTTDEYKMASAAFAQTPHPKKIKIAKRTATVAQVLTLTPTPADTAHFIVTIDGVAYDYTSGVSATATTIVTGLKALINADAASLMAATGTTTLILTSKTAGLPSAVSATSNLAQVTTTASNGAVEDVSLATNVDADWYALLVASRATSDILALAPFIEAQRRIMLTTTVDAATQDIAASTDLASVLKAKQFFRTAVSFTSTAAEFPAAAMASRVLPLDPGTETWAFKQLAAITAESPTDSQINAMDTKNVNYSQTLGGLSVTKNGKVAAGEFLDIIRFIDWTQARIQEGVFGVLVQSDKVPFTDAGIAQIEGAVRAVLEAGKRIGAVVSYTVTVPKASEISPSDKAARVLNGIAFVAILSGAVHSTTINGTVTL